MTRLVRVWRAESAFVVSVLLALVGAGLIPGVWGKVLGAVLPLLGGQAVRATVWAPDTAQAAVHAAALSVASQLTPDITGPAGTVTAAAQGVVDGVVAAATNSMPSG